MINTYIQPPPDVTTPLAGKKVHAAQLSPGPPEEIRQTTAIGDPDARDAVAKVTAAAPSSSDYGLTTRRAPKGMILASFNFNSNADQALAPATGGKINKIWKLWLMVDGDTAVSIKDGATVRIGPLNLSQGGLIEWQFDDEPWFMTGVGNAFQVLTSLAVNCGGIIGYTQE